MPNRRELGYVSAGSLNSIVSNSYGVATGGTSSSITVGGQNYTLLTFTSDDNLVVSTAGLFDIALVGGGGGAGQSFGGANNASGGGGGGDVVGITTGITIYLTAGTYAVDVGAGGASSVGVAGSKSTLAGYVAIGGGKGGTASGRIDDNVWHQPGANGGSGGGAAFNNVNSLGLGISGNNGGLGTASAGVAGVTAGGGGGASSAGGNGSSTTGGSGGNGLDISTFIGGSTYYAGAGGGGGASGTGGSAGNGGVAGKTTGTGNAGSNYGAGGGGTYGTSQAGGAGAAGVVYVRFKV